MKLPNINRGHAVALECSQSHDHEAVRSRGKRNLDRNALDERRLEIQRKGRSATSRRGSSDEEMDNKLSGKHQSSKNRSKHKAKVGNLGPQLTPSVLQAPLLFLGPGGRLLVAR